MPNTLERRLLKFRATKSGILVDCPENVTKLPELWLARSRVDALKPNRSQSKWSKFKKDY